MHIYHLIDLKIDLNQSGENNQYNESNASRFLI